MAATNYTPIQLYFSTTASAVPLAANLAQGELAINITDGKLYYEDNGGVVQVLATKGAGTIGGSTTQIQYNNAGALAGNAAMVFNNSTNVTTLTTLNLTNALGATYGGTAQSAYTQGDVLYASATNTLSKLGIGTVNYILTSTGSVPQWVAPTSVTVNTATNLAGGAAGSVPYQSGVATTTFLAIGAANRVMTSSGTAPQWVTSLTGLTGVSSSSITNTSLTSGRVIIASTAGLEADSANLTFDGTTLSSTGYSTTGLSTLVKTVKIGDSSFNGVAVFAAATPAKLYMGTGTVTDVTSAISATNAIGAIASLGITPIAATNTSVTYTNASTLYIAGAPSAGTNVTITNPYSLYVAAGAAYFGGAVTVAGSLSLAGVTVTSLTDSGLTSGRVTYATTGGLLTDSANLLFNGTTLTSVNFAPTGVVQFSTNAAQAAGSIAKNATYGLTYYGITGSSYDVTLLNNAGAVALGVTTATQNLVTGANLAVNGTLSASGLISSTAGNNANIFLSSGATTGYQFMRANNTSGDMLLGVEGATPALIADSTAYDTVVRGVTGISFSANNGSSKQMRLSSTGLAVTGTLSATGNISASGTGAKVIKVESTDGTTASIQFVRTGAGGDYQIKNDAGYLDFAYGINDTSFGTLVLRLDSVGNLSPTAILDISASTSGQIKFPATQNASSNANTLDDYEEGSWTPVCTSGSGSITSYISTGLYTKVGRQVTLTGYIQITNNGTGGAFGNISGFPFVSNGNACGMGRNGGTNGYTNNMNISDGYTQCQVWTYDNNYPWATNASLQFTIVYNTST